MEIPRIKIVERGAVPRAMMRYHRDAMRAGYRAAALHFNEVFRPRRFTVAHAVAANYRKPAGLTKYAFGSKAFWRSYYGRKLRRTGEALPFVNTGRTRSRAAAPTLVVSTKAGTLRYSVNALNYIPQAPDDFRRLLPSEINELGQVFNKAYDAEYNRDLNEGMRFV